jgi:hypothetical protein
MKIRFEWSLRVLACSGNIWNSLNDLEHAWYCFGAPTVRKEAIGYPFRGNANQAMEKQMLLSNASLQWFWRMHRLHKVAVKMRSAWQNVSPIHIYALSCLFQYYEHALSRKRNAFNAHASFLPKATHTLSCMWHYLALSISRLALDPKGAYCPSCDACRVYHAFSSSQALRKGS